MANEKELSRDALRIRQAMREFGWRDERMINAMVVLVGVLANLHPADSIFVLRRVISNFESCIAAIESGQN